MLSAFTPRLIVELKQRDKSKIESVLAYGNRLLVGLNTGTLRVYRIDESQQRDVIDVAKDGKSRGTVSKPKAIDLLREEEKFSRKPIAQLAIIKEANLLISLSDGYVSFHDMETFALTERLEKTRGATIFAVTSNIVKDTTTAIPSIVSRLAVVVKRRILLWSWDDMEISTSAEEFTLPHTTKSLTWATATRMIVGMDSGFSMLDIETRSVTDVNRPAHAGEAAGANGTRFGAVNSSGMGYMGMGSWVPRPMSTRLTEGQLLLAKDVNTLFIDTEGKALEKRQIPWSNVPEAIGYSYPYLLALQQPTKGVLEVRNPETLSLLQSISLPSATLLHVPQPYISLAHAGKGFLVANERCIWRMGAQGYDSQIKVLVDAGAFEEALSLVTMLEDTLIEGKDQRLREIRTQKALYLFDQRRYREALDLFSEASAPPTRVIALYPEVIAGELSSVEELGDSDTETDKSNTPAVRSPLKKKPSLLSPMKANGKHKDSDTMSIRSNHPAASDNAKLEGKDLNIAVIELCAFLVQTRSYISRYMTFDGKLKSVPQNIKDQDDRPPFRHLLPETTQSGDVDWEGELVKVATLVDTTLFRAYMLARPVLAGPLFRLDNWCSPDVVKDKLYESERYNDLIDFLHGKKLHREALELLERFGKGEGKGGDTDNLRGPRRTVGYLQQLPFEMIDLILQFSEWPVRTEPSLGMEVFLADTENAEALPRQRVLDFLQGIDLKLNLQYLEHIVYELHDQTPEFHERLITRYLEKIKSLQAEEAESNTEWQEKLQSFLNSSQRYNKTKVLRDIPSDDPRFYESRATVLSKLSQHEQALQIYVFQIRNYQKAEDYCNRIYLSATTPAAMSDPDDPAQPESIYTTLLSLYLTPPASQEQNLSAALDLVSRHGSRLPALSTLSILPATLPVQSLESYFQGRMRAANSLARENAIVAALGSVEKTEWESMLLLGAEGAKPTTAAAGRNRRVILGESRLCGVCGKRFGKAAVRVWPDGEVAHYGCSDKRRQDEGGITAVAS